MSKWTQKSRRGGAREFGSLPPPGGGDWTAAPGTSGQIQVHRYADIPLPGTLAETRYRLVAATTWLLWARQSADTWTIGSLTPGGSYELQLAWCNATARISEFSASKTAAAGA